MKIRKTVNYLPPELLSEVLKWLPARNLLKLRVVCKSWNSVISNQRFHQYHLLHQLRTKNIQRCKYVLLSVDRYVKSTVHNRLLSSSAVNICRSKTFTPIQKIDLAKLDGVKFCHGKSSVLGYVDGVLLVHVPSPGVDNKTNSIFLWNPMIGKVVDIPLSESLRKSKDVNVWFAFGFGFDSGTSNCKVVALNLKDYDSKTKVYNLGSRSWTSPKEKRGSIDNVKYLSNTSVSFNFEGGIYWLARVERKGINITHYLRFDLSSEAFTCSKLPDFQYEGQLKQRLRRLSILHESLALVDCSSYSHSRHIRVWIRRKDNTTSVDSWIALYNLNYCVGKFQHLTSNGDAYFLTPGIPRTISVHDFKSGEDKVCSTTPWGTVNFMDGYIESLALLGQPSDQQSIKMQACLMG
ncbi:F-box/kelch-repeat protein At3g23880-like [Silene latifolia]|uniref:F-box/kelch-repeat protein At3g23880-like n=1 Tax=Silene latifolia TaxID=37657 RepID=UPI003D77094E